MKIFRPVLASLFLIAPACAADRELPFPAPTPEAVDHLGEPVSFAELYKEGKYTVVFFYPKAMTPGCTKQACSLRDAYAELQEAGVNVFGVSTDGPDAQRQFVEKEELPYPLIADPDGVVLKAFGVARIGGPIGPSSRQAFLIDNEAGQVIWHDSSASTDQQAADILEALKNP